MRAIIANHVGFVLKAFSTTSKAHTNSCVSKKRAITVGLRGSPVFVQPFHDTTLNSVLSANHKQKHLNALNQYLTRLDDIYPFFPPESLWVQLIKWQKYCRGGK